ncbi:MAG: hypothetical protein NWE89_03710 [Candidatus Bathyarchaeota archaeon]|nr:hypothetical protein [Candidatus Bathyarchaeota archaeon]
MCFKCVEICPGDVLREGEGKPHVAYPDKCWHCGACMMDCNLGINAQSTSLDTAHC